MAQPNVRPTIDLAAGRTVLAASLARVLAAEAVETPADLGWSTPNKSTLLVPMVGTHENRTDTYLLKLHFCTDQEWPPSAQFVNPHSLKYDLTKDREHLPVLKSPEAHMHPAYQHPEGRQVQLVCCSATFEFYDVLHPVNEAHHLWRNTDTFLVTLRAIERAMSNHYHGRFPKND